MNCFSGLRFPTATIPGERCALLACALLAFVACGVETSESADGPASREYDVRFNVTPDPASSTVEVTLQLRQPRDLLRQLLFPNVPDSISDFRGDGDIQRDGTSLRWVPPANGGTLSWQARVENEREPKGLDAWLGPDWGLFRAEDIIPRARTRALKGSSSNSTMTFELPAGWSAVTEYSSVHDTIRVQRPNRRFDQPTGWIVMGDLGVRRERIAGIRVAIAAPQGEAVRRMDMLALLNWTLPELVALLPEPPARLTIVSAGDPMWRGGLSAPSSLYIHSERPLISENSTSALLHEVMHTTLSLRAVSGMDWIVEGLAEYYSLELLRRGRAISARRYETALAGLAEWGEESSSLCGGTSTGATTARAVTLLHALDAELQASSEDKASLDDLLYELLSRKTTVDMALLTRIAEDIGGKPSDVLHIDNLPGCHRMVAGKPAG